jgi:hypothetical protein
MVAVNEVQHKLMNFLGSPRRLFDEAVGLLLCEAETQVLFLLVRISLRLQHELGKSS